MKKTTVLLSILAAVGLTTTAQAQVRFGVKGGVNLSNYSGLTDEQKKFDENLVNANGGVMLNAPLTDDGFFSIQPELLYSGKGIKFKGDGFESVDRMHYLDLPILAKINADGLIFEAGPQLGYMVSRKGTLTAGGVTAEDSDFSGVNRFDFGYIAGVGYEFDNGFGLGVRYNGGLLKVEKEVAGQEQSNAKNSVFQFQVGYLFGAK
ncbi:porin family protein [Hymenobacter metallicola]|uniref:PorT family protein n=1 Tax=Hymenobacter metallicola TaxID=2563114 RepID=A0A4Z0Q913_9BACT|nr:porin family protein [Hymenobacter metallicola]TGE26205.1 PorT family protein [Hymenobacter metallicola]